MSNRYNLRRRDDLAIEVLDNMTGDCLDGYKKIVAAIGEEAAVNFVTSTVLLTADIQSELEKEQGYYKQLLPVEKNIYDENDDKTPRDVASVQDYIIISLSEFIDGDFYTDEGEYEAYLTNGNKFIPVNISRLTVPEIDNLIQERWRYKCEPRVLLIDYPESK